MLQTVRSKLRRTVYHAIHLDQLMFRSSSCNFYHRFKKNSYKSTYHCSTLGAHETSARLVIQPWHGHHVGLSPTFLANGMTSCEME